jgi:hypothetical protein
MDPRYKKIEGKHREGREHSLHKHFASSTVRLRSSVHTVQQLRGCDRGDSHLLFIERNTYWKATAKPIFQLLYSSFAQVGGRDQDALGSLGDLPVQTMRSASLRIRRCLLAVGREMPTVSAISPVLS